SMNYNVSNSCGFLTRAKTKVRSFFRVFLTHPKFLPHFSLNTAYFT
ncbi:hypothetical protein HMPREF9996_02005, partial [Aggregatibacter actinomycetemcomitans Y4]